MFRNWLLNSNLGHNSLNGVNNPQDLNTIKTGVCACGDIENIKNIPSVDKTQGILIAFNNYPYVTQIYITKNKISSRMLYDKTWTAWI